MRMFINEFFFGRTLPSSIAIGYFFAGALAWSGHAILCLICILAPIFIFRIKTRD